MTKIQSDNFQIVKSESGFTLVELILIIILLGILSVTAYVKWPSGLDNQAALMEMKRAIRHTQHIAMTRAYDVGNIWRLQIDNNEYTITNGNSDSVPAEFDGRNLLDSDTTTINSGASLDLYFNGLGEPIESDGDSFTGIQTITINSNHPLTICPQTGFVKEGLSCP